MNEIWFTLIHRVSPKAAFFRQDHDKQATPLDADAQCKLVMLIWLSSGLLRC
jgi:hypothetical protein